jgi:hypothetical protein
MAMIVIGTSRLVLMRRPMRTAAYQRPAADTAGGYLAPLPQQRPSTPPGHAAAAEDTRGASGPVNEP